MSSQSRLTNIHIEIYSFFVFFPKSRPLLLHKMQKRAHVSPKQKQRSEIYRRSSCTAGESGMAQSFQHAVNQFKCLKWRRAPLKS